MKLGLRLALRERHAKASKLEDEASTRIRGAHERRENHAHIEGASEESEGRGGFEGTHASHAPRNVAGEDVLKPATRERDERDMSNTNEARGCGFSQSRGARARSSRGWEQTHWIAPVVTASAAALQHGALPRGFETLAVPAAEEVAKALDALLPDDTRTSRTRPAVVIDIETSGLGGVVVPYIVAAAWHEGDRLRLEQWTLIDPMAERDLLAAVFARLDEVVQEGTRLVSYNGASFDLPRLRARARRLHLDWRCDPRNDDALATAHLDLLSPTRRVLSGVLSDCRLSTVESGVLGLRRRGDMSGLEIAELWQRMSATKGLADALQSESTSDDVDPFIVDDLEAARRHNRGDVWALCSVAVAVASRLSRPRTLHEAVGAARHFARHAQAARAISVLCPHVPRRPTRGGREIRGGEVSDTRKWVDGWVEAALLLADLHRGRGEHEEAARWWRAVCEVAPGNARGHDALAKFLEHRARDPAEALKVARASSIPCPKRIARLQRKAADAQGRPGASRTPTVHAV